MYEVKEPPKVFVNLFKEIREKGGKKLVVYIPKSMKQRKVYPVGLGEYKEGENGYPVYNKSFWINVYAVDKNLILVNLYDTTTKETQDVELKKEYSQDGSVFYSGQVTIDSKRYWVNLYKQKDKEKGDLLLVFKEAGKTLSSVIGGEIEPDFEDDRPF